MLRRTNGAQTICLHNVEKLLTKPKGVFHFVWRKHKIYINVKKVFFKFDICITFLQFNFNIIHVFLVYCSIIFFIVMWSYYHPGMMLTFDTNIIYIVYTFATLTFYCHWQARSQGSFEVEALLGRGVWGPPWGPQMGPGRSPCGRRGRSPRKLMDFTHLQWPFVKFLTPWFYMQYDSIWS